MTQRLLPRLVGIFMNEILERVKHLAKEISGKDERIAYAMGFDCARNGADGKNCHFSLFSRPELTACWERGKRDGSDSIAEAHGRARCNNVKREANT